MGLYHKNFSVNFSYQECKLTYIGEILKHNHFDDFQLSRDTYSHALLGPKHKIFSLIFSYQENFLTCICGTWTRHLFGDLQLSRKLIECIGGTLTKILFGNFQLSKMHSDMHWWDFTIKSFRWISAIKNAYWHALVELYHKIFSAIFSYQEYSL